MTTLWEWLMGLLGMRPTFLTLASQWPSTYRVQLRDRRGRPAKVAGRIVTVRCLTPGAYIAGKLQRTTNEAGVATFWDLTLHAGDATMPITLLFESPGLTSVTSDPVALTPVAAKLEFVAPPPATSQDGKAFPQSVKVRLVTAQGVAVPQAGVTVTVSAVEPTGKIVGPTSAQTDASGVATFAGLGIDDTTI